MQVQLFFQVYFLFGLEKIDDYRILNYSLFVVILLFASSLFFSFINSIYLLAIGIFLMRFSGQGLMSHTPQQLFPDFSKDLEEKP